MNKIMFLLLIIVLFLLLLLVMFISIWSIDEERCYNMPLNRVYEDKLCQLHTQTWEELNR